MIVLYPVTVADTLAALRRHVAARNAATDPRRREQLAADVDELLEHLTGLRGVERQEGSG